MRISLFFVFGSVLLVLLVGCGEQRELSVTGRRSLPNTNLTVVASEAGPAITHGNIIAHIVGPHRPTPDTSIPSEPNTLSNFWVTLEVMDVRDGFAAELKGGTIKLPTCEFARDLVGKTLPLRIFYSPGRFHGADYSLECTSIEFSRLVVAASSAK